MSQELLNLDDVPPGASALSMATQRLARLIRGEIGHVLTHHGDLRLVDWRICVRLAARGTVNQKELAAYAEMEQGQVSRSLAKLEDRGLIASVRSDTDKRARLFSLTAEGQSHFNHVLPGFQAYCDAIDQALSPTELAQYLDLTQRIAKAAIFNRRQLSRENVQHGQLDPEQST